MTSDCARETVETIDRSTVQWENSMTSKCAWETVKTIEISQQFAFVDFLRILVNSKKYQITFI